MKASPLTAGDEGVHAIVVELVQALSDSGSVAEMRKASRRALKKLRALKN